MSDSTRTVRAAQVRVLFRPSTSHYFVSENGHTYPATKEEAEHRFGPIFIAAITAEPMVWIEYDASDVARIACNRARYEAVGTTSKHPSGRPDYGIWDHERKELHGSMPSINHHYGIGFYSLEDAQLHIDDIGSNKHWLPAEFHELAREVRGGRPAPSTSARIVEHNAAAVDLVTALFNPPTHPAA